MKSLVLILVAALLGGSCLRGLAEQTVTFEYFNLSTNIIKVTEVAGLPRVATPGVLVPSNDENQLNVSASKFFETVHINDQIKIVWKENDTTHELGLKRDDCGIPAKLKNGKARFTYLGNGKWRVKRLKTP